MLSAHLALMDRILLGCVLFIHELYPKPMYVQRHCLEKLSKLSTR